MLLELDGEGRALRNFLDDLDLADTDFVATRSALFRADFAGDHDARFLGEALQRFECLRIFLQRADTLNDSGAVAEDREEQFTRLTKVVKPALQRDFLFVVLACLVDGDRCHSELIW